MTLALTETDEPPDTMITLVLRHGSEVEIRIEHQLWLEVITQIPQGDLSDVIAECYEMRYHGKNVTILLTDDAYLRHLNHRFRGIDKPTNVLAFSTTGDEFLGDLALAYETMAHEAAHDQKRLTHHFIHLVIHGMLHLMGYDHDTVEAAAKMEAIEVEILARAGIDNPYILKGGANHDHMATS